MSASNSHEVSGSAIAAEQQPSMADATKHSRFLAVINKHPVFFTGATTLLGAMIGAVALLLAYFGTPFIQEITSHSRVRAEQLEKEKAALEAENSTLKKSLQGENDDLTKAVKAAEAKYADYVRDQQDKARQSSDVINDARASVRSLQASLDREVQTRLEADKTILELKGQTRDISTALADALSILNEPDTASSEAEYLHQREVEQAERNKAAFRAGWNFGGDDSALGQIIKQTVDDSQDARVGESTAEYARLRIGRLNARIDSARERLTHALSAAHILPAPINALPAARPTTRVPSGPKNAQPDRKKRSAG